MNSINWKLIIFAICFIENVVFCADLNWDDELKSAIDLTKPTNGLIRMFLIPQKGVPVQKCCPFGKSYPGAERNFKCTITNKTQVDSKVYETGNRLALELVPIQRELCNSGPILIGDEEDEMLWISKTGNLLHTDLNGSEIEILSNDKYCVERNGMHIIASLCQSVPESVFIDRVIPICKLISVPLLLMVAITYLIIPKLRTVHGETLALYSICLSISYLLMFYDSFSSNFNFQMTVSGIQFFILSSFCWLLMMTVDMIYHLWSYYQNPKEFQRSILLRLTIYSFIAFGTPLLIVVAYHSNQTEILRPRNPLVEIMIPISLILLLNFLMLIPIYKYYTKNTPRCLIKEEVKHRAKSLVWILIVIAANWKFEMVSILWPNMRLSLIPFPTLDALQGMVMVCVFILMPHYKKIIKAWWVEKTYRQPQEQVDYDQV